ncbi:hypothetical protein DM02DRAFT_658662 [Periconia macrospinosa]|uniref:C2 domain-containing protein n=1 Tax=Periconia macrospinosa TaxID=97972 RepID=A0A2V1DHA7_9PLEO|nr:hypothetical protein DM02DRAFT_658662 [Periconia macrospinosa]
MAAKVARGAIAAPHTAGIFSDMTVDGPVIGTLVAIMDRAKNLPNRRSMGKQDPYCAARLGKEAKKTNTDRRGGQTPRWDQELRFTVHDSPDYHQLKVSIFNDDKKTELIGETFVNLEAIITPGGGQSDTWHTLNCKGKYAGEVRLELTFYDIRPKEEKPAAEKKRETTRPDGQRAGLSGPRESTPVKRRPLPSDPTGASPSPQKTPEFRGLQGVQSGPRSYPSTPRGQRESSTPQRRPVPDASSHANTPPNPQTAQNQQYAPRSLEHDPYTPPNPHVSSTNLAQYNPDGFDMSYTAPKPYETPQVDPLSHIRDTGSRTLSQDNFRSSQGHHHNIPVDLPHSHSAPSVPTSHGYEPDPRRQEDFGGHRSSQSNGYSQDLYQDPSYQVEPLRLSRNSRSNEQMAPPDAYRTPEAYADPRDSYDTNDFHGRRASAMQPTVEDEDDVPPPPPVHRKGASTIPQPHDDESLQEYREEPSQYIHEGALQQYGSHDYGHHPQERRYTHPRPESRPVSRDATMPSPLRNETMALPASLVAGVDASRQQRDSVSHQMSSSYETRSRQHSEPGSYMPPQYDQSSYPHPLRQQQSAPPSNALQRYQHPPPEEPRRRSPDHVHPIVKPRAVSPAVSPMHTNSPMDDRAPRMPNRSMPTRKSVSPRPPPSEEPEQRRLSGVPFAPDSFDVYNPAASSKSADPDRPGSSLEMNEKGQIVTFNGRVIDASDHLPVESWAAEPERKGPEKERPTRTRPVLSGARDLEAARDREERYRRERAERERIRNAANATFGSTGSSPSNALVTSRHDFNQNSPINAGAMVLASATPPSTGRNRLQKRSPRPMSTSTYESPTHMHSSPGIPMPNTHVLRERENVGGYGSSPSYGQDSRHSIAAPPIPAKIPIERGSEDMMALSLELQSIDIGPGSGGRRPNRGTARRY